MFVQSAMYLSSCKGDPLDEVTISIEILFFSDFVLNLWMDYLDVVSVGDFKDMFSQFKVEIKPFELDALFKEYG